MIDITLLGTAAMMPLADRALASALLRCTGRSILFDCGEGTQSAAKKAGESLQKVDIIALSHYHGDHIFGLPGLLQTLDCFGRTEPLIITGPKGLEKELAPIMTLVGETAYEIHLITIPEDGLDLSELGFPNGARLTAFSTEHRVESQGYVFSLRRPGKFLPKKADELNIPAPLRSILQKGESVTVDGREILPSDVMTEERKGLKFVFTGDTAYCDSIIENSKDADLLLCEATFAENDQLDKATERGHMTFEVAARAAKEAGVKKLCLTHFSPRVVDPEEFAQNAVSVFENTVIGSDGMKLTLNFEE